MKKVKIESTPKRKVVIENIPHQFGGDISLRDNVFQDGGYSDPWQVINPNAPDVMNQANQPVQNSINNPAPNTGTNQNILGVTSDDAFDDMHHNDPAKKKQLNWFQKAAPYAAMGHNVFNTALAVGQVYSNLANDRRSQAYTRQLGMSDNIPVVNPPGGYGDYTQQGVFRPNQQTPSSAGIYYPQMKYGGMGKKKIQITGAPMQKGGIVVNQGNPNEQYDQNGNRVYYYPSSSNTTVPVIPQVTAGNNNLLPPAPKSVSFENERDIYGNLSAYRPVFHGYDYRDAIATMHNLPYRADDGTLYDRSPMNFSEANNHFVPESNSNQWTPRTGEYSPVREPLADWNFVNFQPAGDREYMQAGGKRTVLIEKGPDTAYMATGGYANTGATRGYGMQQTGSGYSLDRFWSSPAGYPGVTSQINPYGSVGRTLPEAPDPNDPSVINAEKSEQVLGDFDQDGRQELMNVDGPSHPEGGKDVSVPENSFIFSDTKALKIKDPAILATFGMTGKKGYTPAQIAQKYDLNKFKAIIDNPHSDEMAKKTAQLMSDNYLAKLNSLAEVQEKMKGDMGMEHFDPNVGKNMMQMGGNPNTYGDIATLGQMASLRRFVPFEPVPQAVVPNTTFLDPTRAIAAQQEVANQNMLNASTSADQRVVRANSLAYQGEVGKNVADTVGQYANQNADISNKANEQVANITNQLMAQQAQRAANLNQGNYLADRDYQSQMNRLQSNYNDKLVKEHNEAVNRAWLNKTSPYFNIGPTGFPEFKPGEAAARFDQMYGPNAGSNPSQADNLKAQSDYYNMLISTYPMYQGPGGETAARQATAEHFNTRAYEDTSYKPGSFMPSGVNVKHQTVGSIYGEQNPYMPSYQYGGIDDNIHSLYANADYGNNARDLGAPLPSYTPSIPQRPVIPETNTNRKDIAIATNNPGNIKYTPWMQKLGAYPSGIKATDDGKQFAAFPDLNTGYRAYQTQLFGDTDGIIKSNYYKSNTPVWQAMKEWSNNGYGGDIYPEIQNKTLGQLTPAERDELTRRQIKRESGAMYKQMKQAGIFRYGGFALKKFVQ